MMLRPALRRFLRRRFGDSELEDILQETFLHLLGRKEQPAPIRNAKAYIFRTALSTGIDSHRADQHRQRRERDWFGENFGDATFETPCPQPRPDQRVEAKDQLGRMVAALQGLPPTCREAFVLARVDGLPHKEIATRLSISISMVEKHVARALRTLSAILTNRKSIVPCRDD